MLLKENKMAKKVTKNKTSSKRVTLPKLNPRNFTFAMVAVLMFSVLGAYVYQGYNNHTLKAKAAGWTLLSSNNIGDTINACQTTVSSPYGPLWRVKLVYKTGKYSSTFTAESRRAKPPTTNHYAISSVRSDLAANTVKYSEIYVAKLGAYYANDYISDRLWVSTNSSSGLISSSMNLPFNNLINVGTLAAC